MTVPELYERWEAIDDALQIVDVRERAEWEEGHIPGSVHGPYHDIDEIPEELDRSGRWRRSARPGSARGRGEPAAAAWRGHVVHVVEGGVPSWGRQGWPIERPGAG